MNTELFIARRYLFAKKSHNAINWVSGISMAGVAVATAAMICVLSVFNGFRNLVATLFTAFDPELKVELAEGKTIASSDPTLQALKKSDKVAVYTEVLEENALVTYNGRQMVVTIKGVSSNFKSLTNITDITYGDGDWCLEAGGLQFAIPGIGVAQELTMPINFDGAIKVWAPRHGKRINMANPLASFRSDELYSSGLVFCVNQAKYDANVVITSLGFAQQLFDNEKRVSHIELRLAKGATKTDIEKLIDKRFTLLDRYQQQSDTFRLMNIEKLVSYIFLAFIMLIATFNIVGSLSMLIIEKQADTNTLHAMGASRQQLRRIFTLEGRLISSLGAFIGLAIGLLLCWLQMTFGLITLGSSEGSFIINAYPVAVELTDVLIVMATVLAVSWITVLVPIRTLKH